MSRDKESRGLLKYSRFDPRIVVARISPDVGHPDINSFPDKALVTGEPRPDGASVNIAVDGYHRCDPGKFTDDLKVPDVSCMPHLMAISEVFGDPFIEEAMGIGEKSNS
jgi:hypothetical protein